MARFEVLGRDADRELIRSLARRLAEDTAEAARLRTELSRTMGPEGSRKGGILKALLRSPLAEAGLDLTRSRETGRKIDL